MKYFAFAERGIMTNRAKKTIAVSTVLTLAAATIFTFTGVKGLFKLNARELTDFDVDLIINSSNVTSGSGSVTLNGNTFDYTGFVVSGDAITLSAGSTLSYNGESGSSFANDNFVGGGFTKLEFSLSLESTFEMSINGSSEVFENRSGAVSMTINSPFLDVEVSSGSFAVSALHIKYSCVAPSVTQRVLLVGHNEFVGSSYATQYTNLMDGLGNTAVCDVVTTENYTYRTIYSSTSNIGKNFRKKLNENAYDAIVLQITRRITESSADVYAKELESLTGIKELLHSETDNIYVYAPNGSDNQDIWYDNGYITYTRKDPAEQETSTRAQSSSFYSSIAEDFATAVEGKVINYAGAFEYYYSNISVKSDAKKQYLSACCLYSSFFNRAVPAAGTWDGGGLTANAMKILRRGAEINCVTK